MCDFYVFPCQFSRSYTVFLTHALYFSESKSLYDAFYLLTNVFLLMLTRQRNRAFQRSTFSLSAGFRCHQKCTIFKFQSLLFALVFTRLRNRVFWSIIFYILYLQYLNFWCNWASCSIKCILQWLYEIRSINSISYHWMWSQNYETKNSNAV